MRAIVYQKYGSPDVLQLREVAKPAPGDDEILVKIHAAAVNPLDWHFMRAVPFVMRLVSGILKPKYKILGADMAGQVAAVGSNVTRFRIDAIAVGNGTAEMGEQTARAGVGPM